MSGNEMWTVKGATAIFTNEEDAKVLADFLNNGMPYTPGKINRYPIQKIYKDCYVSKIKKGYDLYTVTMYRDGDCTVKKAARYAPNAFGFKRRSFMNAIRTVGNNTVYVKALYFSCLAADQDDAKAQAEKERVKTILDDNWKYPDGRYEAPLRTPHYFDDLKI